jgi:peptidyl-prolyl cis-trans isomerase SurA
MMKLGTFNRAALMLAGSWAAAAAFAQTAGGPSGNPGASTLNIPADARFIGKADPNVRRATAIVNGIVITGTEIDHRLALITLGSGTQIPPEELPRLRQQILRNLVDEVLQIQAAEDAEIKIQTRELDTYFARYAQQFKQTPQQFSEFLRANGSSPEALKRQIHGELAWSRLQRSRIEPFVNVSEEEVKSIIDRLNAARGTQEYRLSEICISATPETAAEARANAQRIVQQLRGGASFPAYARQFSEASTAAVGGDLGWVRTAQLPEQLAAAVGQLPVGQISDPIAIPGGFSVVALSDARQVLTADPRDAVLSLKQLTVRLAGLSRPQAEAKVQELVRVSQSGGGCGGADAAAAQIGAEVITNDQVRVRELPGPLQQTLLALGVGQATPVFGATDERVSTLILCGRDDSNSVTDVSFDQVYAQLAEQRVNMRARRLLRDLRRDAVIDYQ